MFTAVSVAAALIIAAVVLINERGTGSPPYPKAWDPRVAAIAQFVQAQRGLVWKHPVKVEFLAPAAFDALMAKENAPARQATQDAQVAFDVMRAMGMASGNIDLAKSSQQLAQADIVGQYVDADRTAYVRGDRLTPYVRSVLAHELTHALQAQYFDLERMRSGHSDDDQAVTALIEGDAVRVQNAYERSLAASDRKLLVQEEQQGSAQARNQNSANAIPQFLIDQSEFPYDFGPTFLAALVADGGNAEVDAAFKSPPTLDGQILDPNTYTAKVRWPTVPPALPNGLHSIMPPSGFGEVPLIEMLGDQIGFNTAWSAVQGWRQDQFVPYRQHGQLCVALAVLSDSGASAGLLARAGQMWASHLLSASVSQDGTRVDFNACDPGASWKPARHGEDPYLALALRSALMYQLISDGHLQPAVATCATDQLMIAMGPQALQDAEQSTDPNSPAVQQLRAALIRAVPGCAGGAPVTAAGPSDGGNSPASQATTPSSPAAPSGTPVAAACVSSVPYEQTEAISLNIQYEFLLPADPTPCISLANLHFMTPQCGCVVDHVHIDLNLMGGPVTIPAGIGVDAANDQVSGLFTESDTGIVAFLRNGHYTLGQLFVEWGHPLTQSQIGNMRVNANYPITWYVNGKAVSDPANIILHNHDEIWAFEDMAGAPVKPVSSFSWPPGY